MVFDPPVNFRQLYDHFNAPVTSLDCGEKCAPHNPHGIPFCCDICKAVPAVYIQEWNYLGSITDLWHSWRGNECLDGPVDPQDLREQTPETMVLLACNGPHLCQREFRAISCRQFPFFPYITFRDRFIGMAYDLEFEATCWVISHLEEVTHSFRSEFISTYDEIFRRSEEEFDAYAFLSEKIRELAKKKKHRISILHRNGNNYLLSPKSEKLEKINLKKMKKFGPYKSII